MKERFAGFAVLCLVVTGHLPAQEPPFTTDRPGIADSPFHIRPGYVQPECGLDYVSDNGARSVNIPNTLLRLGATNHTEFRLYTRLQADGTGAKLAPEGVGGKVALLEQRGAIPFTAVMAHVYLPTDRFYRYAANTGFDIILLFQNNVTDRFSFNYNIGCSREAGGGAFRFMSSWCFNFMLNDRFGWFGEYYNYLPLDARAKHALDAGIIYLPHPVVQLDISAGVSPPGHTRGPENRVTYDGFVSCGISFRIGYGK